MRGASLYLSWLVAIAATAGSLYFSEVRHFIPCTLCWYQRILMYPLVLLLGIASYDADTRVVRYVLPMSVLGAIVAAYHVLEQKVPGFGSEALCRSGIPCSGHYIQWLGFITIPVLSLTAFVLIAALLFGTPRRSA